MYVILHIPTGSYLIKNKECREIYKANRKELAEEVLNSYFNGTWSSKRLTLYQR